MQAWQVFLDELKARTPQGDARPLGQRELLGNAVHDAYQRAADRLTQEHEWDDEHTLVVMRGLNAAVKQWLEHGGSDWNDLQAELRRREDEVTNGFGQPKTSS